MYTKKTSLEEYTSTINEGFSLGGRLGRDEGEIMFSPPPPPPSFVGIMIITKIKGFSIREGEK